MIHRSDASRHDLGHELTVLAAPALLRLVNVCRWSSQRVQRRRHPLAHGVDLVQVEDATGLSRQVDHAGEPDQAVHARLGSV